jgi:hypothetical protein
MRETAGRVLSRCRGKAALTRRLRGLLLSVHRYQRARVATDADARWSARLADDLQVALSHADPPRPCAASHRRAEWEGSPR